MAARHPSIALVLSLASATLVLAGAVVPAWPAAAAPTLVETGNGFVQGQRAGLVNEWLGIRYAASPAGTNRWQPPLPPAFYGTRQSPYQASQFSKPCPQNISQFGNSIPLPITGAPVPGSADSEDCLFLNVYAPAEAGSDERGLPVLFWIHGGSNQFGEGSSYDPTALVTQGHVIVVTINYRLGALGWLAHPLLDGASPNSSGNYGLMDQQFAMRWVRDNIAGFGGDPDKVTIAGESAGALDSCAHVASPTAAGLFRGAIIESGCIIAQIPQPVLEFVSGAPFVNSLGCTTLDCLRQKPVSDILAAERPLSWANVAGPNVLTLPLLPAAAFAAGTFNKVPVLQGTNLDEGRLFIPLFDGVVTDGPGGPRTTPYTTAVAALFAAYPNPPLATIESHYPIANYMTDGAAAAPGEAVSAIVTDSLFACTARTADQLLAQHVPVWAYEFQDQNAPQLFDLPTVFPYAAAHASELQYLFDPNGFFPNLTYDVASDPFPLSPLQRALSHTMIRYWTNFVATLDPNRSGGGFQSVAFNLDTGDVWLPYVPAADNFQALVTPHPRQQFGFGAEHQCDFWAQIGLVSGL